MKSESTFVIDFVVMVQSLKPAGHKFAKSLVKDLGKGSIFITFEGDGYELYRLAFRSHREGFYDIFLGKCMNPDSDKFNKYVEFNGIASVIAIEPVDPRDAEEMPLVFPHKNKHNVSYDVESKPWMMGNEEPTYKEINLGLVKINGTPVHAAKASIKIKSNIRTWKGNNKP